MTGQSLLDLMEVLDNELQLQTGEANVTRGLKALNAAQDYFESLIALQPRVLGGTSSTVTTTANTETTAFPTGLLRVDRLQFVDPTTSRPTYDLDPIRRVGGQIWARSWPLNIISSAANSGKPTAYWTNGKLIYWSPLPDATHTVRWHGLQAATDITASGAFLFPDICALPFASFANKLMHAGVGDETGEITQLAAAIFAPTITALSSFNRDGAIPFEYTFPHDV